MVVAASLFSPSSLSEPDWWQPLVADVWQWQLQLQGDLEVIAGVSVYAVDADVSPNSLKSAQSRGAKVMCYISAGSVENWRDDFERFPESVIGNAYDGWPGEWWLDIRQLKTIAPIMRKRIKKCKDRGFDVLDADNINGFENDTGFELTRGDSVRYIRWLASEAHRQGLSFSLKNGEALIGEVADVVDMMQSESCYLYDNCERVSAMTDLGKPVFAVEYIELVGRAEFETKACQVASEFGLAMILRTQDLKPGTTYVTCR